MPGESERMKHYRISLFWCVLLFQQNWSHGGQVPLLDLLETAQIVVETSGITFGEDTPPDTLGTGFSHVENHPGERDFMWATGTEAWVYPWLGFRHPRVLTITVKPFVAPSIPRQSVSAEWNGELLFHSELDMNSRWQTYQIGVPEEVQVEGRNRLRFQFTRSDRPTDCFRDNEKVQDVRPLSVAFDALVLDSKGAYTPGKPVPTSRIEVGEKDDTRLLRFISPGEVHYHLCIPLGARLRFGYRAAGEEDVPFSIQGTRMDGTSETLFSGTAQGKESAWQKAEVAMAEARGNPYRLTFCCRRGGIVIEEPMLEVPENIGIDDLLDMPPRSSPPRRLQSNQGPNVLFYLIDALRADHLSAYGYSRPTSPNIDALAASGVLFEQAYAHNPWTKNSMAAILTGRYPSACGMVSDNDVLSEDLTTFPEALTRAGYTCYAFSANGYMSPRFGFDQGFEEFILKEHSSPDRPPPRSDELNEEIFARLDEIGSSQPFFVYIHAFDPHSPYTPNKEFAKRFDRGHGGTIDGSLDNLKDVHEEYRFLTEGEVLHLIDLYDAETAYNDVQFQKLLDRLKETDLYEDLLIIVTSDHGEEFLDHGNLEHSRTLHRESLHVPLIVKWPGAKAGHRVTSPVRHADLMPTLCEICGADPPDGIAGESLVPLLQGEDAVRVNERVVFSELSLESMVSLRRNGTSVIVSEPGRDWRESPLPRVQWFRTDQDPDEQSNRAGAQSVRAGMDAATALWCRKQARKDWEILGTEAGQAEIDDETRRILEALGYMKD